MPKNNDIPAKDPLDPIMRFLRALKTIFWGPIWEVYIGRKMSALPAYLCLMVGTAFSLSITLHVDDRVLQHFHHPSLFSGKFRDLLGITSVFWGFLFWGYHRMGVRSRINRKLNREFINAGLETKLKETPQFRWDFPIDEFTRKLRLKGRGLPLSSYLNAKEALSTGLNANIIKIEHPHGNRELVDVVYTNQKMLEFWELNHLGKYKDFSFPIGMSYRGEITASLVKIPHLLVAGESGGGKSSFIRMLLTVLLTNNRDLEVFYLDFKKGMENQMFEEFANVQLASDASTAATMLNSIRQTMETRMKEFKEARATNLESFNNSPKRVGPKSKRIVVAVDEISEIMPTFRGKNNAHLGEINSAVNQIARMGRAVGVNLIIGVQKPDAKNLDPTIKANLSGILCFPVTHFSQSTIVLGNSRACELNSSIKGRAIWKRGIDFTEVQTPLLTPEEVENAKGEVEKYWGKAPPGPQEKTPAIDLATEA